jgi:NDP-sugar pyrophosphorylase family protein
LDTAADYRRLALHGLTSLCQLKPIGKEIGPGVWIGDAARINKSARILGPAYIGAGSRLRPGVLVAGGSSVERHCDVDCGTVIENSSILPRTYLGPGLHVNQSLVNGSRLTHLGRNLEVELAETNLLGWSGNRASRRLLETLGSLFTFGSEPAPTLSTPTRAPASLDYVRTEGFFD